MPSSSGATPGVAKVTAPALAEVIERPRLDRLLAEALRRPLVWVSGPAGSGKTTQVASYLERTGTKVVWYQVDAGDADPVSLFHFLRLTIDEKARSALPSGPGPEHLPGFDVFAKRFFRELAVQLQSSFVLVFDNLQEVADDTPFVDLLCAGLAELPPGGRAILVSRAEPAPAFSRFRASRQLTQIGWRDLRFEPGEADDLVRLLNKHRVDQVAIGTLADAVQGWAAGLVLLAERVFAGDASSLSLDDADVETVFDYFASEVLRKVEPAQRAFLLKTSFLPTVTPETAEALTGHGRAGDVLANLSRRNFFTVRRSPGTIYEYHPLFRRFLQLEAVGAYPAPELAELRSQAITLLIAADQLNDAVALIHELGEWGRLIPLLASRGPRLLVETRHRTIERWLAPMPEEVCARNPWLAYWLGAARALFAPIEAQSILAETYARFRQAGDATGAFMTWATLAETMSNHFQYTEAFDHWIDAFDDLISAYPQYPSRQIEGRVALSMMAALAYRRPDDPSLAAWARRGMALAAELDDPFLYKQVVFQRCHPLILSPHDPERAILLEKIATLFDHPGASDFERLLARLPVTADCCLAGRHNDCVRMADEGFSLARRSGIGVFNALFYTWKSFSSFNAGDAETGRAAMHGLANELDACGDAGRVYYHFLEGYERYLNKDIRGALLAVTASITVLGTASTTLVHFYVRFLWTHLLSEAGQPDAAARELAPLKAFALRTANPMIAHHCALCDAEIALCRSDRDAALQALREGMMLGRRVSLNIVAGWRPDALGRLCGLALDHDIDVETVQRIIRERGLRPGLEWRHLENWPRPLHVHTLGDFAVIRDGARMAFARRAPRKPLDLLKGLIAFGGSGVSVERLQDALWPEADGDAAHKAFEVTLLRLRRLLGIEGALVLGESRLTLSPDLVWVDVQALKDAGERLRACLGRPPAKSCGDVARLTDEVVARSQGDFLQGLCEAPWAVHARDRLGAWRARLLHDTGRYWEDAGEPDRAATCYETARLHLDADSPWWARLQQALRRTGRTA